jgi:hypothetical protein
MAELRTFGLQVEILGSVEFVDAYLHSITYLHGAVLKCKLGHLNNCIFKAIPTPTQFRLNTCTIYLIYLGLCKLHWASYSTRPWSVLLGVCESKP